MSNLIWITNDIINKRINKNSIIENGWKKGRKINWKIYNQYTSKRKK